jgi:hypothetical protein
MDAAEATRLAGYKVGRRLYMHISSRRYTRTAHSRTQDHEVVEYNLVFLSLVLYIFPLQLIFCSCGSRNVSTLPRCLLDSDCTGVCEGLCIPSTVTRDL